MNLIKEYRELFGLSQSECVEKFKELCPDIDAPLLSKMEKGICMPTEEVSTYVLKELASRFNESIGGEQTTLPLTLINTLKQPILEQVYKEIAKASASEPCTKDHLRAVTGMSDRAVRKSVEELRLAGARIVSTSGNKGYFFDTGYYYKVMRAELLSRASAIFKLVAAMDGSVTGQVEWII